VFELPKYSLVLLDADGTLFDYDRAEAAALKRAFTRCGFAYSDDIQLEYRKINIALWLEFEQGTVNKESLQTDRFVRLFEKIGVFTEPSAFNEIYLDYLAEGSCLIDGAHELCRELAPHCTLAIASNGVARTQRKRLELSPLAPYIRYLLVSEEAGYQKPQRDFFDYAFRVCGHTDKTSAIILGDMLSADIEGGAGYGIATCWYNPRREKPPESSPLPDYEIHRLTDFLGIMGL
jgi:2-haloacid dehalogenase